MSAMNTGHVTDRIEDLGQQAAERAFNERLSHQFEERNWLQRSSHFLSEQPIRSLLIGLGIGFLISAAFVRR